MAEGVKDFDFKDIVVVQSELGTNAKKNFFTVVNRR